MNDKYETPDNEKEILPNKLELNNKSLIEKEEAKGFAKAGLLLGSTLTNETVFDIDFINNIHKIAFEDLYEFAGKYRTVNMSKGGFTFPASMFLDNSMNAFQTSILSNISHSYSNKEALIRDIAHVHAELLFIHPYREGNGRTARLLANLMCFKAGFERLKFELLQDKFKEYVRAVQQAGMGNYKAMEEIISLIFPN
jgi:cell filamentation protein